MLLYICAFEDKKHLKVGICDEVDRVLYLNEIYKFNYHRSVIIRSEMNSLIRLFERLLLVSTEKYKVENFDFKGTPCSNAGKTEIRTIEAIPIIEKLLKLHYDLHKDDLEIFRFALLQCEHCNHSDWTFDDATIDDLPWSSGTPIIRALEK